MSSTQLWRAGAAALLLTGGVMATIGTATAASGDLDPTFGSGGTATAPIDAGGRPTSVVTQPDGKVLVLSNLAYIGGGFDVITRFNADGSPDTAFGVGGQAHLTRGDGAFNGIVVMADGAIVAVGTTGSPTTGVVDRLTALGQPDTTFDGDGQRLFDAGVHGVMYFTTAFEQAGGKLVVVGSKGTDDFSGPNGVFVTRLGADGGTDATFGTAGQSFSADIEASGVCGFGAGLLAAQPDGSTFIVATEGCGTGAIASVYRLAVGGTLTNLNADLIEHIGGGISGVAPLPGGGLLATANQLMGPSGPERMFLPVSADGVAGAPIRQDDAVLTYSAITALPDGRFAVGLAARDDGTSGGVEIVNAAGQLDTSFGGDGIVASPPVAALATAPGAKLVTLGGVDAVEVRRYETTGDPGVTPVTPKLTPVTPARILDTRAPGVNYTGAKPGADQTITVQVAGRGGVPATGAAAVVLNVTATQADGPGFVTVWPSDQPRPNASNLNLSTPGQTIPNLVTVPLGTDGAVKMYTYGGAHLIADVAAWFPAGAGFVPLTPNRILDTRAPGIGYTGAKPVAGGTVDLVVAGRGGVAADATAVVMNVTATEASGPGYVTVWPTGTVRPNASNLNVTDVGQTIPNQVMVPIGANGSVSLFTYGGSHLLADVAGYFTAGGGFNPLSPERILDTRAPGIGYTGAKPVANAIVAVQVAGKGGVPATGATAVVMNVTATDADAAGYVTAWPSAAVQPLASNLNLDRKGQTIANLVVVPIGADGKVLLYTLEGTHLLADVAGWIS